MRRVATVGHFRVRRALFTLHRFGGERVESLQFVWFLSRVVVRPALVALIICAVAWVSDRFAIPYLTFPYGAPLRPLDHGAYVAVASAIAQTLGALLGLYFTAIGVVVGGLYSKVPTDVRALAISEQVGTRYLRLIALTCIYALYLAGLDATRLMTSRSGFAILVLLTTYSVFAFAHLGLRVYHFLDPELLARRLNGDVYAALQHLRIRRPHAGHAAFQAYHRKRVENALATYDSLFAVVTAEPPNLDACKSLLLGEIVVWASYAEMKSEIPAMSEWYRPRPEYQSLLTDASTSVTVHLATATMPQPRLARDYLWFDRSVADAIVNNLSVHLKHADVIRPLEILSSLQFRLAEAAEAFATEEALFVERSVSSAMIEDLPMVADLAPPTASEPEKTAIIAQLCDFVAFAPMQILLGFAKRIRSVDPKSFLDVNDWVKWLRRRAFYNDRLPRNVILQLEEIAKQLSFELNVEDHILTSDWYLRERYATALINEASQQLESIARRIETAYLPLLERLSDLRGGVPAMHMALRGLEACHKLRYHARDIAGWCETMASLHVRAEGLVKLPNLDALGTRADLLEAALHDQVATFAFKVFDADAKRDRLLPDYFGQAYMMVAQETFDRLRRGAAGADALFRAFFGLSILAAQRLGNELSDVENATVRATYITEPVLNLLELSGYSFLFSQLSGHGEMWQIVRSIWDKAIHDEYVNVAAIQLIYDDRFVVMRPWYALRFNWQKAFRDDVVVAATEGRWLSPFMGAIAEDIDSWHHFDLDARDAFLLVYLRYQTDFADMKLSQGAESLQHSLDRINNEPTTASE